MSYAKIEELVVRMNIFTRNEGVAIEAFEDLGNAARVRGFQPEPGNLNPIPSIFEVVMAYNGSDPQGEPLVEIIEDEDAAPVYISDNALAIVSFLLSDIRPHWATS